MKLSGCWESRSHSIKEQTGQNGMNRGQSTGLRILMLCYEHPPLGGGGGRAAAGLARSLVQLGHAVDFVTMGFRHEPAREVIQGVQVYRVPCFRTSKHMCTMREAASYLLPALWKAHELAAISNYDINHTHFILPDGINAELLRRFSGVPFIVTAHGSDVPGYNPHRLGIAHRLLAPLWHRVARGASRVVCPSAAIQALFEARCPDVRTDLIPYGFDADRFAPGGARELSVLVVTRMLERKGVQYLLEAVRDLGLRHQIHIVGDGPYLEALRHRAQGCRARIVFHGWLDNNSEQLKRLYQESEVFVLASESENFPVSLLEAMAAGLAIITTSGTGCAEVVGDAGVLVPPRDAAALQTALLALTEDPERTHCLGQQARKRLENEFGWRRIAQQYVDLYREFGARRISQPLGTVGPEADAARVWHSDSQL